MLSFNCPNSTSDSQVESLTASKCYWWAGTTQFNSCQVVQSQTYAIIYIGYAELDCVSVELLLKQEWLKSHWEFCFTNMSFCVGSFELGILDLLELFNLEANDHDEMKCNEIKQMMNHILMPIVFLLFNFNRHEVLALSCGFHGQKKERRNGCFSRQPQKDTCLNQ